MRTLHEISSYTMTLMFNGTEKHRLSAGQLGGMVNDGCGQWLVGVVSRPDTVWVGYFLHVVT